MAEVVKYGRPPISACTSNSDTVMGAGLGRSARGGSLCYRTGLLRPQARPKGELGALQHRAFASRW